MEKFKVLLVLFLCTFIVSATDNSENVVLNSENHDEHIELTNDATKDEDKKENVSIDKAKEPEVVKPTPEEEPPAAKDKEDLEIIEVSAENGDDVPKGKPVPAAEAANPEAPAARSRSLQKSGKLRAADTEIETLGQGASSRAARYEIDDSWDSLTSEFAPPPDIQQQRPAVPYVITEQRLQEIRSQFMYWYWDKGGDSNNNGDYQNNIHSSSPTIHKNLNFQLPFFGFRYNYTRVSLNGYLEFSDPPETFESYPLVFPVKDWPKKNDPAFIGIFFSKCRPGSLRNEDSDKRKPGVYFRTERDLQGRTDKFGTEVRERLKWDIRQSVIGSDSFDPKHAIFVTWKNVTFSGGISQALYRTNTFQMVLVTDEVFTYAIFNYLNLQWTSHTEANGDTTTGEGGVPAFVGFNAGNGTRSFAYEPYSQASVIRDLTIRGYANGFPGRHVFRIDENILLGTCNKDIDGVNLPLMFAPESGNMLGGTIVNVTGPCFELTDKVSCKFDTKIVDGVVVDKNRVICVQPQLFVEGYIYLEIAIAPGSYKWRGQYFVETPAAATEKIFFMDDNVYTKDQNEIKITWVHKNLTTNENSPVRISLWGYREKTTTPEFLYIGSLAENVNNIGEYTISPAQFRNRDDRLYNDMLFGFIQINLTDSIPVNGNRDVKITPVIWSRPIPLAWYFGPQWERLYGKNWGDYLCDEWTRNDRYLKNFAHELPQCPCTIQHALTDKGRYLPDYECDKDSNPKCFYHRGSRHCVRSGAPNLDGSEQHCCYDKNGYLMLSYDQMWGSSPHRSHSLGYLPWDEANKVPTLSYWFHDVVPLYACCMWQTDSAIGCETFRFERRPTQDCVAYQSPAVAGVFGDPHIVTFDGLEYTFNGKGEFTLIKVNSKNLRLDVQGRFEQLPMNAYGEVRATQLTSIAARGNSSSVIEVRLRPKEARWRYRLDVLYQGKRVYFDRPSLKFQHFPGVLVYTPTYILNQSEVIIMFDSGAGVEVVENQGYMSARAYLPWTFINQTLGLFGNWSFDQTDDFTLPDGTKVGVSSNLNDFERVYTDFGMKWMLEDRDVPLKGKALFHREFGRTSSNYNNVTFKPEFKVEPQDIIPSNRTKDIETAIELCHEYYQCKYDYAMSLDRDLAHFSLNYHSSIRNLREINDKRTISCGVLETPRFGRKSNFLFIPGSKVTFECNEGFILVGDNRRECMQDGRWDVPEYGYTQCLRQQEYSSRTAGLTSGIVLLVIVPIVLIIVYFLYKILQRRKRDYEEDDESTLEQKRREAQEYAAARLKAAALEDDDDLSSSRRETEIN